MKSIKQFRNIHEARTILLVGNGGNLKLTPPENFDYISIAMNTAHLYNGDWKPSFYTAVDQRVVDEFGGAIAHKYQNIPKIVPTRINNWAGDNFYEFTNAPGVLWSRDQSDLWQDDIGNELVTYGNIMHVAIKLAYYFGAGTILIIGMEHNPDDARNHFWGVDEGMPFGVPLDDWFEGYIQLRKGLAKKGVQIFNISAETYVPGDVLPQDNFEKWRTQ